LVVDLVAAAGLGLGLGAVTGMPIGVVNVAIVDAATRGEQRFATGIGIGGALADTVHSSLAFVGVGHLIALRAPWSRVMAIAAAVVIATYVIITLRRRRAIAAPIRRASSGVVTGILLTLPNPAPLAAWAAIATAVWPTISLVPALVVGGCVGIGSAVWFTFLARTIPTLPRDGRVGRWLPGVALALLAMLAVVGVVRAFVAG
jgi:threonine/homoserine/homoserine lactone efflux protein